MLSVQVEESRVLGGSVGVYGIIEGVLDTCQVAGVQLVQADTELMSICVCDLIFLCRSFTARIVSN